MRRQTRAALIGAALTGLTALAPAANAETMPPPPSAATQPRKHAVSRTAVRPRAAATLPAAPATSQMVAQNARPPAVIAPVPAAVTKSGTTAFDENQRALLTRVNAYLSGLNSLVGDFVQVGPDRSRTEGRFYLQKPGRVRFEYNPPSPIEMVADGQSVVVRDRKLATQDVYPLSQTPLRFLLAERIDLAKDTNLIAVHADDTFVTVAIEERQTLGGSHRLMLMFGAKDFQLKQWTVTDPQGFDTTVALYNLDPTKKPDPAMFRITYERKEIIQ